MKNTSKSFKGKIAFVQSCWHEDIVNQSKMGFSARMSELGFTDCPVDFFEVPGAFEIPLKCKQLLSTGEYALAVAAGFVVDGGIYRHEFVAQSVINALMQVQLEIGLPVLSVVLTPKEFSTNKERADFFMEHMVIKGREAADVAAYFLSEQTETLAQSA